MAAIDIATHPIHLGLGARAAAPPAINEPGTWHTADLDAPATVLCITAGLGTRHRPR